MLSKNVEDGFQPDVNVLTPSVVICSKGRLLFTPFVGGKGSEININLILITELIVKQFHLLSHF